MKTNGNLDEILVQLEKYSFLYLGGAAGVGKTALLAEYADWLKEAEKEYLSLDMAKQEDRQKLALCLRDFKNRNTQEGSELVLLLDQFHCVQEEEILSDLTAVMGSKPVCLKIVFVSRKEPPERFYACIYKGILKEMIGVWKLFKKRDLAEMVREAGLYMSQEQIEKLYQWCAGWPAIAEIAIFIIKSASDKAQISQISKHPFLLQYISQNIWEFLEDSQKELCKKLAVLPCIPFSVGEEGGVWVFQSLIDMALLYPVENGVYAFPGFFRGYLIGSGLVDMDDKQMLDTAGEWLEEKGMYKLALDCFFRSGNAGSHRKCMISAHEMLFWEQENETLRQWIDFSMRDEQTGEALFLEGMICFDEGDTKQAEMMMELLKQRYFREKEEKRRAALLYLNLLYYNPKVSIVRWMEEAQRIVDEIGPVHIFSLNCAMPCCLCAGKELSELFYSRKKEIDRYRQQWNYIFEERQRDFFDLAEIEYLMETNRLEDAFGRLKAFLVLDETMPAERMEVLFGILSNLFMRGMSITGYEELVGEYYQRLTDSRRTLIARNAESLKLCYDVWKRQNVDTKNSFLGSDAEDYKRIERHNCYYLLNKARNYLFSRKNEKAYMLFERLGEYYNRTRMYRFRTECSVGQAVAALGMDEEIQALKHMNIAMATADRFRYVGCFCLFGNAGKTLLEKYCATMPELQSGTQFARGTKRTYYYGNVVGVSYENYVKVLVRAVRKNASRYPFESAENAVSYETLTETEISVLKYIEQGYSNLEAAKELNIELTTVKKHVYNIYKKLEVNNRVQAVQKGKSLGILIR